MNMRTIRGMIAKTTVFFDTLDSVTVKGKRWWALCKPYNIQPHFLAHNTIDFSKKKCYDVITVE